MTPSTREQAAPAAWRRYLELTKPKVVTLVSYLMWLFVALLIDHYLPSLRGA